MGYIKGLETDVFISYAHKDIAWVDGLDTYLASRVPQLLEHDAQVVVWRDRSLSPFDQLWPTLQDRIRRTALLLSICSPSYVTSQNCEKEVDWFFSNSVETPRVERRSRVARVVIIPYHGTAGLRPCFERDDTVRYNFFENQSDGTFRQYMTDSSEFTDRADKLAQQIALQLRRIRTEAERAAPQQVRNGARKVFIASGTSDQALERKTLLNELSVFDVLTVPDGSYTRADMERVTRECLSQANCSIHLLGERPGTTPEDSEEPIAQLQCRLAFDHRPPGFTQIVWAPTTLKLADERQKKFVDSVRSFGGPNWPKGLEIICGGLDDLLRGVQGVLNRETPPTRVSGSGPLYLLCNQADIKNDDANLAQLRDFLCLSGIQPEFPAFEDVEADLAQVERDLIAQSCATLIYYGRGGDGWTKLMRSRVRAILGELKTQDEHVRALYVSEPPNAPKRTQYVDIKVREFNEARGFPPLLVLGEASAFDGKYLKPLLDRLSGGH